MNKEQEIFDGRSPKRDLSQDSHGKTFVLLAPWPVQGMTRNPY
jgi:hypothetical protein